MSRGLKGLPCPPHPLSCHLAARQRAHHDDLGGHEEGAAAALFEARRLPLPQGSRKPLWRPCSSRWLLESWPVMPASPPSPGNQVMPIFFNMSIAVHNDPDASKEWGWVQVGFSREGPCWGGPPHPAVH